MDTEQTPSTSKRGGLVKNILLVVMTIFSLMCFAFASIQKLEADKQKEVAVKAQIEAEMNFKEAEMQRAIAMAAQREAEKQAMLAAEALAACEKNKKK